MFSHYLELFMSFFNVITMKRKFKKDQVAHINSYKNIKSPQVIDNIDLYTYLHNLSNTDKFIRKKIEEARYFYEKGYKTQYDAIKCQLPCYTLNFGFDEYKKNTNIIGATGLIYIDMDNETNIDLTNKLIFASWRSLSNNGRGILVQIDGLDLNNFQYNYNIIAEQLGIKADNGARKATQYTIQSHDSNLYINEDSIRHVALEVKKKIPTSFALKKEKKDSNEMGIKSSFRFNNISDYDFNDELYIYFPNDKEDIAEVYVPQRIEEGQRNSKLYAIGLQYRALNPDILSANIERFLHSVNIHNCKPPLREHELSSIIKSIMNVESPKPFYNRKRRIIFNPDIKLSRKEIMTITNGFTGAKKSERVYNELKEHVKSWNYDELGKVTGKKLIKQSGRDKKTVWKYYRQLKNDPELF